MVARWLEHSFRRRPEALRGRLRRRPAIRDRRSGNVRADWAIQSRLAPNGRQISRTATIRRYGWSFWTIPLDGKPRLRSRVAASLAQRLRDSDVRLGGFVWNPGADTLYFEGRSDKTTNLWRIRVNPSTLEWVSADRLTTSSSLESGIALSRDGKRLAFGSRTERTVAWSMPFDPVSGRIVGDGEAVTPESANAEILVVRRLTAVSSPTWWPAGTGHELWIRLIDRQADHLRTVEVGSAIVQPRWSRRHPARVPRRPVYSQRASAVVLLARTTMAISVCCPAARSPEMGARLVG